MTNKAVQQFMLDSVINNEVQARNVFAENGGGRVRRH